MEGNSELNLDAAVSFAQSHVHTITTAQAKAIYEVYEADIQTRDLSTDDPVHAALKAGKRGLLWSLLLGVAYEDLDELWGELELPVSDGLKALLARDLVDPATYQACIRPFVEAGLGAWFA